MPSKTSSPTLLLAFCLGIATPGGAALMTTALPSAQMSALTGAYQRAYEAQFTQRFPMRARAQTSYTALTLGLFGQAGPEVVLGDDGWLFTGEEFRAPSDPQDAVLALEAARDALARDGIALIPLIVPDKARIYADLLPRPRGPALEQRYAQHLAALAEAEFAAIDAASILAAGRAEADTYLRTDTHWSPHGAALVAAALAEMLDLKGAAEFVTEIGPPASYAGDLMPFVETGAFADWVGVAPEMLAAHRTTARGPAEIGLFGAAEVGIVLVGTSFSAREAFNFAGALSAASGFDVVNLARAGQGPFTPMTDALANGAIAEIAPQVVVWEIPERYLGPRSPS